jgi:hypothetical protein
MATVHYLPINTARTSHVNLAFVFLLWYPLAKVRLFFIKCKIKQKKIYKVMVKQNCLWEIAVRRRQDMHSLLSTNPYTGGKGALALANAATVAALIQFCLTLLIDKSTRQATPSIADNFEHAESHSFSTTDKQTERM